MVLMSAGKAARHQAAIITRPSGGGNKKGGLPFTIGMQLQSNPNYIHATQSLPGFNIDPYVVTLPGNLGRRGQTVTYGPNFVSRVIQTQRYGYKATIGPQ